MILNKNLFLSLIVILFPALSHAQSASCDEGVIRLPDRSGTVVICSALASKIPNLAKQLTDATRLMGSQREQIAELTRLVRGLNGVSQGIGVERQAQMLQSLSVELAASQRGGDDKTKRAVENLSEKVEELQAQMLSALSNQSTYAATSAAIKGPIGDSIAKLELSSASRQLGEVNARLKEIQTQVGDLKNDTTVIKQDIKVVQATLSGVAKEVSDDPRKELIKRGYTVDGYGLEKAMREKDFLALRQFNDSGYVPKYFEFERFLFEDGWDPAVFKALSPKILGLPQSCNSWDLNTVYPDRNNGKVGFEEDKLRAQVSACGKEKIIEKLKQFLINATSEDRNIYPSFKDQKSNIDEKRRSIESQEEIDKCRHDSRRLSCGITPEAFAELETIYFGSMRSWEETKKEWTAEVNRTIEAVKKM